MTSIANSVGTHQTSAQAVPSPPTWFGELTVIAHFLQQQGVLAAIAERVRFARKRFGRYELIDFLAVLFGYAISGERTDGGSSTRDSSRSPSPSWPYLTVTSSPPAQRSRVF